MWAFNTIVSWVTSLGATVFQALFAATQVVTNWILPLIIATLTTQPPDDTNWRDIIPLARQALATADRWVPIYYSAGLATTYYVTQITIIALRWVMKSNPWTS